MNKSGFREEVESWLVSAEERGQEPVVTAWAALLAIAENDGLWAFVAEHREPLSERAPLMQMVDEYVELRFS